MSDILEEGVYKCVITEAYYCEGASERFSPYLKIIYQPLAHDQTIIQIIPLPHWVDDESVRWRKAMRFVHNFVKPLGLHWNEYQIMSGEWDTMRTELENLKRKEVLVKVCISEYQGICRNQVKYVESA